MTISDFDENLTDYLIYKNIFTPNRMFIKNKKFENEDKHKLLNVTILLAPIIIFLIIVCFILLIILSISYKN